MAEELIKRIEQLEIQASYQEDTIKTLNETVGLQHQEIQMLQRQLDLLSDYLKGLEQQMDSGIKMPNEETPPPHY